MDDDRKRRADMFAAAALAGLCANPGDIVLDDDAMEQIVKRAQVAGVYMVQLMDKSFDRQMRLMVADMGLSAPEREQTMANANEKPSAGGLWRDNPDTPEGKYLVKRRDGSVPEWPSFVLGARDPAAPAALRAYAEAASTLGYDRAYVEGIRRLADRYDTYRAEHGEGDPDRGRHRVDDPQTVAEMLKGQSA